MKLQKWLVLSLVAGVTNFVSLTAWADELSERSKRVERVEREYASDHFAAGGALRLDKSVIGDLIAAGGNVDVDAPVGGDALLAGGNLRINGNIAQSLYAAGGQLSVNGSVGHSARVAGGRLDFGPKSELAGNLSAVGGEVTLEGRIKGYVQAMGGRVLIDGVIDGDMEVRAGQVELGPKARIGGKLRYASREDIKRDPAAQVSGPVERIALTGDWRAREDMGRGLEGMSWVWSIGLLVLAGVLVSALPRMNQRLSDILRSRYGLSLLLGFVTLVCVPVAALLLLITVIGVPLGLITIALYLPLLLLGYVSTGIALGDWAAKHINSAWSTGRAGRIVTSMLGVLAVSLLGRLPWVGGWIVLLALLIGLGALVLTAWRARDGGGAEAASALG